MSITPGYKEKRKFIACAIRRDGDARGEDYILAGAVAQALQTKGVGVEPWITEQISRDLDDGKSGGQPVIHVGEMISVSGAVEMAGSGAANTPVAYQSLFEMAGHDVNTDIATETSYNRILTASQEKDGTVYFYWEGMYHILLAGKCTLTASGKIGELGYLNFEAKGIYGGTVAGSIPSADFSSFVKPVEWSKANTSFSLDGQNLNLIEFEEALNNTIEHDEGTEVNQIFIDDWSPEGKFVIEAPTLGTFDPFAIARQNTILPYSLTHGTAAGNIFEMASSGVQLLTIKAGAHKGKKTWDLGYRVIRGNDTVFKSK